jgi:8-oxo-dGTP pyrophosphatase MutT (NUDIX family)
MLSKKVKISIMGTLLENFMYSCSCNGIGIKSYPGYFISEKRVRSDQKGVVIALVTLDDGVEKAVVVPEGKIMYEPQIRNILGKIKNLKISKISCLYEKSCGAIVFYRGNSNANQNSRNNINILLVKNNNGRHWSFPKGHVELHENEQQTALREIKEETGLDVTIIDGFREVSDYCPFGKVKKRAVFFLAESKSQNVTVQKSEISDYIWADINSCKEKCNYTNDIKLILKAEKIINRR